MTDKQLFQKFQHYGKLALSARNKCIGMLPEIYKRRIYEKHLCSTIYEFAAKFAGLSQEQVNRVLNLERRLVDRSVLHTALVQGEVSVNKLRKVISIATVENQEGVLDAVKNLSVRAVETMVRDLKQGSDVQSLDGHVTTQSEMFREDLQLSDEVRDELLAMQKKGININKLLGKFLREQREELEREKEEIVGELSAVGRYVPVVVKNVLRREFGDKCAVPGCDRRARETHHLLPYAITRQHDPRLMVNLCGEHHRIAHAINRKILQFR